MQVAIIGAGNVGTALTTAWQSGWKLVGAPAAAPVAA